MSRPGARGRAALGAALVLCLAGCTGGAGSDVGTDPANDLGEVAVQSGDAEVRAAPVCTGDIPEDYTTCANAPQNVEQVRLAPSLVLTVSVPPDVAESGYRLLLDGRPVGGLDQPLTDTPQPVTVPQSAISAPDDLVLTVESLRDVSAPQAVWQFVLQDPAGEPAP